GARKVNVAQPKLKPGDRCAECGKGKLYPLKEPGVRVRIVGQAPIQASVYELERMRCNLCGDGCEAPAPEGVGEDKYDETSASMEVTFCFGILPRAVALPNGGDAEVWERSSVPPAGRAAGKSGDPVAVFDAVGDGGGGGGVDHAGARRVDPAGGARGGAAQRRYVGEDPADEAGNQRGSYGRVHVGDRGDSGGAKDGFVFQRRQACGRESGGRDERAGGGTAAADLDVRRAVAERAGT